MLFHLHCHSVAASGRGPEGGQIKKCGYRRTYKNLPNDYAL